MKALKNIEFETPVLLSDLVTIQSGQVVSKTLIQNDSISITLFAFDKAEEISTHKSGGDALVTVLEGTGKFTINSEEHILSAGQSIVMPANSPHAVYAQEAFKMELVVVFAKEE